ncbi:MAG: hypothetical protein GTO14_09440 [Anaerolineales bacterium]|nr:hypothetical protein [Anaerolineales bacterium]
MKFFNQNSFVISTGLLLLLIGMAILRGGVSALRVSVIGGLVIAAAALYIFLNPGASTFDREEEIRIHIGRGTPVLLEFQSPY